MDEFSCVCSCSCLCVSSVELSATNFQLSQFYFNVCSYGNGQFIIMPYPCNIGLKVCTSLGNLLLL